MKETKNEAGRGREMREKEEWITTKELCEYLKISRHTVLVWTKEKGMPFRKIGRNWRFKISEIEKWMEKEQEKA